MYYNGNDSLNFNSSIWGADNSFFPRASEKPNKETEDLLADLSYLGSSSSEDITTNQLRTENVEQQNTGASENQSHGMSGNIGDQGQSSSIMGSGNLGTYPSNQNVPFNMNTFDNQGFNTSTNPLYGTYFMGQNNPSMGNLSEGTSPTNPSAQSFIGSAMHPSMYGWTHYCIPHMPAYPIPTFANPYSQMPMGSMGSGQMGTQFPGGMVPQAPIFTYPDISSTGAYTLSGTAGVPGFTGAMGSSGASMNPNIMNTQNPAMTAGTMNYGPWGQPMNMWMPGMPNQWLYPPLTPSGMNSMAIFPFTPYTGGMGPVIIQPDDDDDMDNQDDNMLAPMNRNSKGKHDKKRKKHKKHCFYYNAFSNYPYYSPVGFPMQHHCPENCGLLWLSPFLLNLDMD